MVYVSRKSTIGVEQLEQEVGAAKLDGVPKAPSPCRSFAGPARVTPGGCERRCTFA
jgi:hypothetical protein